MIHEPGIYFGLPEEAYHADPSLSSSGFKKLLESPPDYWWESSMNPDRPEEQDTAAKAFGSALHRMILEGQEAFDLTYAVRPEKGDYKDLLVTVEDLKAWCAEHDVKVPSGARKEQICALVREADPNAPIWDDIWSSFQSECEASGKVDISFDWYSQIAKAAAAVLKNPHLQKAFTGGRPEVSVFWEHEGLRYKARFDYLKPRAIVDLKSFSNPMGMQFDRAVITGSFARRGYHIQAAHYLEARAWIKVLWEEGRVFGDVDPDWLSRVAVEPNYAFVFVFYQTQGAPVAKGYQFNAGTIIHGAAQQQIAKAVSIYRDHMERFGSDMWVNTDPIHTIMDEELPAWILG